MRAFYFDVGDRGQIHVTVGGYRDSKYNEVAAENKMGDRKNTF